MMRNTFVGLMAAVVLLVASQAMALTGTYVDAAPSNVGPAGVIASGWHIGDNKWGYAITGAPYHLGEGNTTYIADNCRPGSTPPSEDPGELTMTVSGLAQDT